MRLVRTVASSHALHGACSELKAAVGVAAAAATTCSELAGVGACKERQ